MVPPILTRPPAHVPEDVDALNARIEAMKLTHPAWHGPGKPRFRSDLHVLQRAQWRAFEEASERFLEVMDELVQQLHDEPALLRDYFSMPETWQEMSLGGAPWWNLFARMDVFYTVDGRIQICEINTDTPSGQPDMWALLEAFGADDRWGTIPGGDYNARLVRFLRALTPPHVQKAGRAPALAIVYPTDITEDLELIRGYMRLGREAGFAVVHGGPRNLHIDTGGRVRLLGEPVDVILRHYKTDWWGERRRMWYHAPFILDPEPLDVLAPLLDADARGTVAVVNPFGAMPTQSKKALAYMWEHLERFSPAARETVRRYVPMTRRLEDDFEARYLNDRSRWVLKSDFGCEGEEVVVGRLVTQEQWRLTLKRVIPERWVVQEFFEIQPLEDGSLPNFGVYTIAGKPAGLYTRTNPPTGITDTHAMVLPVAVAPDLEER